MKIIKKESVSSMGYQRVSLAGFDAIHRGSSSGLNDGKVKRQAANDFTPTMERFLTARGGLA